MPKQEFEVKLKKPKGVNSAYCEVPFDVRKVFGAGAQVRIKGTVDGYAFRGSLAPMGGGKHMLGFRKEIREAIGKTYGGIVHIILDIDAEERIVEVPADLAAALKVARLRDHFDALAYTHRKEFVRWIEEAKRVETRARRLAKTVQMIGEGKNYS